MIIHCGRWVTFGHGDSVPCGKIDGQTGKVVQCEPCQIATLRQRAERAEAERDEYFLQWQNYRLDGASTRAELKSTIAELTATVERMREAIKLHVADLELTADRVSRFDGFGKTTEQFRLAIKELRAALGEP